MAKKKGRKKVVQFAARERDKQRNEALVAGEQQGGEVFLKKNKKTKNSSTTKKLKNRNSTQRPG